MFAYKVLKLLSMYYIYIIFSLILQLRASEPREKYFLSKLFKISGALIVVHIRITPTKICFYSILVCKDILRHEIKILLTSQSSSARERSEENTFQTGYQQRHPSYQIIIIHSWQINTWNIQDYNFNWSSLAFAWACKFMT